MRDWPIYISGTAVQGNPYSIYLKKYGDWLGTFTWEPGLIKNRKAYTQYLPLN